MQSFDGMFMHFLKDVYYVEQALLKAMSEMESAAQNERLKEALTHHKKETEGQIGRLEEVFAKLGAPAEGVTCEALVGLLQENQEVMKDAETGPVRDAVIVACAQAIEHYEIARYGTMVEWAREKGQTEIVSHLEKTLEEEKAADATFNELAIAGINKDALQA